MNTFMESDGVTWDAYSDEHCDHCVKVPARSVGEGGEELVQADVFRSGRATGRRREDCEHAR